MAHPGRRGRGPAGLDDHGVEPEGEGRDATAVRHFGAVEGPEARVAKGPALSPADRLLGQPELAAAPPSHFHDDELARRPRIDGDEIELASPDPDVPPEDAPSRGRQPCLDEVLRRVSRPLSG